MREPSLVSLLFGGNPALKTKLLSFRQSGSPEPAFRIPALEQPETNHSVLPNRDGSRVVCVWEADSVNAVRAVVEDAIGDFSSNDYFEVDSAKARGLPTAAQHA